MIHYILIESLTRYPFNNCPNHIVIEITVIKTNTRFIFTITFGPLCRLSRVNRIQRKIAPTIINGRKMRQHQSQSDYLLWKSRIAHRKTN